MPRRTVKAPIPYPISREKIEEMADSATQKLHDISRIIMSEFHPPPGAYVFFSHNAHALARVADCKRIIQRMYEQIGLLAQLNIEEEQIGSSTQGSSLEAAPQQLHMRQNEINSYTQQDMESLYIFGDMLLDQWAILAIIVGNLPIRSKDLQTIHPFIEVAKYFENGGKCVLDPIWVKLREELLWLKYQMRFYRNRFIVHANRPWQRGTTRSSFGEEYKLFTPSPPGFLDDKTLDDEIRDLISFAPKNIQDAPDDYWEKSRPGALIERIFNNIGNIPKIQDRERIANIFAQKGGSTPTFQIIAIRLFHFIAESTQMLCDIVPDNISNIDIGKPFKTSDMMIKDT
jgi:hypothetical protein